MNLRALPAKGRTHRPLVAATPERESRQASAHPTRRRGPKAGYIANQVIAGPLTGAWSTTRLRGVPLSLRYGRRGPSYAWLVLTSWLLSYHAPAFARPAPVGSPRAFTPALASGVLAAPSGGGAPLLAGFRALRAPLDCYARYGVPPRNKEGWAAFAWCPAPPWGGGCRVPPPLFRRD